MDDRAATGDASKGREIGGCRLLRAIGQGGMGAVWLARHLALDKTVVVKLMHASVAAKPGAAERFLREARAAARLEHPNVVSVIHAGVDARGEHFLVMPFVDGESLTARLDREGRLPLGEALRIARDVARALGAAHAARLVHRDVKPSNILIARTGEVKVVDFGLAKSVDLDDGITAAGTVVGTPHYMAPEQAAGEAVDARADLYALGATLFHALAGRRPLEGGAMSVLTRLATEAPPDLGALRADAPPAVTRLVARLLAKSPAARPATAEEVIDALDAAIASAGGGLEPTVEVAKPGPAREAGAGAEATRVASPLHEATVAAPEAEAPLIALPAGAFTRGTDAGQRDQKPARTITLRAFRLERGPVTMARYAAFLAALRREGDHRRCHADEPPGKDHRPGVDAPWARAFAWRGDDPPPGLEPHPVVLVDWFDAFAFAAWAGRRLPTEAEREYAAGGRHGSPYPWGDAAPTPDRAAFNRRDGAPSPADARAAGRSPEGILDLAGNVWEWCADRYSPTWYAVSPAADPRNDAEGAERVVRGGSVRESHYRLRRTERAAKPPGTRLLDVGFRCAADA